VCVSCPREDSRRQKTADRRQRGQLKKFFRVYYESIKREPKSVFLFFLKKEKKRPKNVSSVAN
jgi:hypothetical protein